MLKSQGASRFQDREASRMNRSWLRGSIILQNCGHWLMHEQPHAVNKELLMSFGL
jgi:pimeloyl-ACP methyl ester carboxylesterase